MNENIKRCFEIKFCLKVQIISFVINSYFFFKDPILLVYMAYQLAAEWLISLCFGTSQD